MPPPTTQKAWNEGGVKLFQHLSVSCLILLNPFSHAYSPQMKFEGGMTESPWNWLVSGRKFVVQTSLQFFP